MRITMKRSWRWCDFTFYGGTILIFIVLILHVKSAVLEEKVTVQEKVEKYDKVNSDCAEGENCEEKFAPSRVNTIETSDSHDDNTDDESESDDPFSIPSDDDDDNDNDTLVAIDDIKPINFQECKRIQIYEDHLKERGFTAEQIKNMSTVGKWILSPEGSPRPIHDAKKDYLILTMWAGVLLHYRHVPSTINNMNSQWSYCSVQNCRLSYDEQNLDKADAVLFPMTHLKKKSDIPTRKRYDQRWIFMLDELPNYEFHQQHARHKLIDYNGIFNWTMTYQMNSDVPVPYGRSIKLENYNMRKQRLKSLNIVIPPKSRLVSILNIHCSCSDKRWPDVLELKEVLGEKMDIIGECDDSDTNVCYKDQIHDCRILQKYKFHLSFEKENRSEYLTHNVFWNAYAKYAVPIISGPPKKDCERLLPPHSFIHVDDFKSAEDLAKLLIILDNDEEHYLSYHSWRKYYVVYNEHGFYGSPSSYYCRICEALNYNSKEPKVYNALEKLWKFKEGCFADREEEGKQMDM